MSCSCLLSRAWCTDSTPGIVLQLNLTRHSILPRILHRGLKDMELHTRVSDAWLECDLTASGAIGTQQVYCMQLDARFIMQSEKAAKTFDAGWDIAHN